MAKKKHSGALQWITKEAKHLRRKYPKRFSKWTDYVAQASAIYASKHKGKSPVGKKRVHKPAKVKGIKTTGRHVDKNRITANIQVGSILNYRLIQNQKTVTHLRETFQQLNREQADAERLTKMYHQAPREDRKKILEEIRKKRRMINELKTHYRETKKLL